MDVTTSINPLQYLLVAFMLTPILTPISSVAYFRASPSSQLLILRLLASVHGVLITLVFLAGAALPSVVSPNPSYGLPYQLMCLLCVVLMALSFFLFRGRKVVHLFQILNFAGVVATLFLGGMAITGVWL
jgi:hypothetical protein